MDDEKEYGCANCNVIYTDIKKFRSLGMCKNLTQRLLPGEVVPDGECTTCGAFVYEIEDCPACEREDSASRLRQAVFDQQEILLDQPKRGKAEAMLIARSILVLVDAVVYVGDRVGHVTRAIIDRGLADG